MECPCGYEFALDPKKDFCTDNKMFRWIQRASNKGTYFFTNDQLYTAVCNTKSPAGKYLCLFFGFVLISISIMFFTTLFPEVPFILPWILLTLGGVLTVAGILNKGMFYVSRKKFDRWLTKYEKKHPIPKLIKTARLLTPPPNWGETDIYEYGVERIFLMQRRLLVDLFVLNHQHTENRALVISGDGYPTYLQEKFETLLDHSPEIPFHLFHDATRDGEKWAAAMQAQFGNRKRKVIDTGISKNDLKNIDKVKNVALNNKDECGLDVLPMGMLCNGIALSVVGGVAFGQILEDGSSADAHIDFG